MRLRNIPGANEAVAASPYCIQNAAEHRGQWHAFFENDHPIHIEIGMGKGKFLMDLSEFFRPVAKGPPCQTPTDFP